MKPIVCLGLLVTLAASTPLSAAPYSRMVVFGDSMSDVGNAYALTQYPPPPYADGRLSNGPIWVERLAPLIGVPVPTPNYVPGPNATNYAIGGARITTGLIPSIEAQVMTYGAAHTPEADDLFIFWAGANDMADGQANPAIPATAMSNAIAGLVAAGAKNVLVLNLPPLGYAPRLLGSPEALAANAWVAQYNTLLAGGIDTMRSTLAADVQLTEFDVHGLFMQLLANPGQAGFTNTTDRAFVEGPPLTIVPNPDEYLYWDDWHPTQAAHSILAGHVAAALIPEPVTPALLLTAGLCLLTRRGRRAA